MSDLQIQHDFAADRCTVALVGEARLETIEAFDAVAREIEARSDTHAVLLDLSRLEFMDSASTGSILRLHLRMAARGGKLVMHSLPRFMQRLFDRLGLDQFHLAADAATAAEQL